MTKTREEWLAEQKRHQEAERQAAAELRKLDEADAGSAHEKIISLLKQSGEFFSTAQRNEIVRLVKPNAIDKPGGKETAKEPKYQLDSGKTWMGSGRRPPEFVQWAESSAGKKWRKENPGKGEYPAFPNPNAPK